MNHSRLAGKVFVPLIQLGRYFVSDTCPHTPKQWNVLYANSVTALRSKTFLQDCSRSSWHQFLAFALRTHSRPCVSGHCSTLTVAWRIPFSSPPCGSPLWLILRLVFIPFNISLSLSFGHGSSKARRWWALNAEIQQCFQNHHAGNDNAFFKQRHELMPLVITNRMVM